MKRESDEVDDFASEAPGVAELDADAEEEVEEGEEEELAEGKRSMKDRIRDDAKKHVDSTSKKYGSLHHYTNHKKCKALGAAVKALRKHGRKCSGQTGESELERLGQRSFNLADEVEERQKFSNEPREDFKKRSSELVSPKRVKMIERLPADAVRSIITVGATKLEEFAPTDTEMSKVIFALLVGRRPAWPSLCSDCLGLRLIVEDGSRQVIESVQKLGFLGYFEKICKIQSLSAHVSAMDSRIPDWASQR